MTDGTEMKDLVLLDTQEREVGRCSIEGSFSVSLEGKRGVSVDLGPVGYFRVLDVRSDGDPTVLVVEPTEWRAPGASVCE